MKHFHLLARPLAATAVVGIALMGLAGVAGASTVSVSAPGVVGGLGTNPVVDIGSGSVAPAPGATATVPAHGDDDVQVNNPNIVSTGSADPTGVLGGSNGNIASEHSSVDACVAEALLTDRSPNGCGSMAGGSSSLADSIARVGTMPSLADSLSRVGACVRTAGAAGQSIDTCSKSEITPPGSLPAPAATAADEVGAVLAENGLCEIGQQLGMSGLAACTTSVAANDASNADAAGTATAGKGAGSADVCLGLAAITHVDGSRCSISNAGSVDASAHGPSGNGITAAGGPTGTARASAASAPLNAACAARESNVGGTTPSTTEVAGGFAGLGFVLAGIGSRIRRMRRPVLA